MATLKEYVPPVPPEGPGMHHTTGIESKAAQVVADTGLLREVLRRAALICPEELERAAQEGRERLRAIAAGEWRK